MNSHFSIGRWASLACLLEVAAPKPGNVHRGADFENLKFEDFLISAEILGQTIDAAGGQSVGAMILSTVRLTMEKVATNTNLGIALLICPLAMAMKLHGQVSPESITRIIDSLDEADCRRVYQAIRTANPGGLGVVGDMDVADQPPNDLIAAMKLSADRDLVAQQYTSGFHGVLQEVLPLICRGRDKFNDLAQAIVFAHVKMISRHGDSLIARKCGIQASRQAKILAARAIDRLESAQMNDYFSAIAELDFWMRSDGHRRNPGTTADMIAAGLFVGLASGKFQASTRT